MVTSSSSSSSSSPWNRQPVSVLFVGQHHPDPPPPSQTQQHSQQHLHNDNTTSSSSNNNHHKISNTTTTTTNPVTVSLQPHRPHLSVWDLIGIGVGGTIGSGIFVLTGQIASQYAGRATYVSFIIAGMAAALSGLCYAELSGRIPFAPGSTYVYAYICLGEYAAIIAASCLTLEYGVAGAAVARTWGDKVRVLWLRNSSSSSSSDSSNNGGIVNIPAFLISAICTSLLLMGIKESKRVMNAVTILKMCIVLFMIIGGFVLYNPTALSDQPFLTPLGVHGIFRGATTSFFGYLGYDEICCVANEAIHPARDLPRAVLGTLCIVTICYVLASIALTGMLPYTDISPTAGFPDAFHQRNWEWAAQLTAAGELITLPVVVLISFMAQPRLTYSMSMDGLLPSMFRSVDVHGNMIGGTFISGTIMTLIATFVPFTYLDDLISAGILLAFSMTNSCLVLLRCQSPMDHPHLLEHLLIAYNVLCFVSSMLWSHDWSYVPFQSFVATLMTLITITCLVHLTRSCHRSNHFGGSIISESESTHIHNYGNNNQHTTATTSHGISLNGNTDICNVASNTTIPPSTSTTASAQQNYFTTPLVPYLPCFGMAVNWYLISQLDVSGIFFLFVYLALVSTIYFLYCAPHSNGHVRNWNRGTYESVQMTPSIAPSTAPSTTTIGTTTTSNRQQQRSNPNFARDNNGEFCYEEGESELCPMPYSSDVLVRSTASIT